MEHPTVGTAVYSKIVKSTIPPWSLRQMETLETRVGFVNQVHKAATAIIDDIGAIDVQFFASLILTLADTKSLSILCSLEDPSKPGGKGSLLHANGVKELITAVAKCSILKINSLEELEVFLLLVDVPLKNIYEWYQRTFRKLSQYPEIITSADLDNLVTYLRDNGNLLQFIPTSTLQSYIILSGSLELLQGFDTFTLDLNDKDTFAGWLSKISAIASYQEERFFVTVEDDEIIPDELVPRKRRRTESQEIEPNQETPSTLQIDNESVIPGDLVYVDVLLLSATIDVRLTALQSLLGPYKVLDKLSNDQYELEIPEELGGVVKFEKKNLIKVMSYKSPTSALKFMSPAIPGTREDQESTTPKVEGSQVLNVRKRSSGYRVNLRTSSGRIFFELFDKVKDTKEWKRYVSTHPIIPEKISKMEEIDEGDDMEE